MLLGAQYKYIKSYDFKDGINRCLVKARGHDKEEWVSLEILGLSMEEAARYHEGYLKGIVSSSAEALFAYNYFN